LIDLLLKVRYFFLTICSISRSQSLSIHHPSIIFHHPSIRPSNQNHQLKLVGAFICTTSVELGSWQYLLSSPFIHQPPRRPSEPEPQKPLYLHQIILFALVCHTLRANCLKEPQQKQLNVMPWFYRNQPSQTNNRKDASSVTTARIFLTLLVCYGSIQSSAFSPQMTKHLSLLHASTRETKTTTVESRPIKPVLSSEVKPMIKKLSDSGQPRRSDKNPKYRTPRQRCSRAQNAKRRIRFLYSKAR
jgi:hypothetical protein